MANRIRARSDARQLARGQLFEIGRELRIARLASGKRQVDVGRAARITAAYVSRIERGRAPGITHRTLTELAAVVGIRLWMRAYPTGRRLLDAPQLELFTKLTGRSDARLRWRTEVPVPIAGDLRAADALATLGTATVQFELITRLADFQAQSRAALLKKRDLGADRLILVIKASHANRRALAEAEAAVAASFPLGTRRILGAMGKGVDPGGDGILFR